MFDDPINAFTPPITLRGAGGWPKAAPPVPPGAGAIFRIQRVREETGMDSAMPGLASLDPVIFGEFASLIKAAKAQVVRLDELRAALTSKAPLTEQGARLAAFTFDGASRGLMDHALPVMNALGLPFTVFISPQAHDENLPPWQTALEALIMQSPRITLAVRGQIYRARCHSHDEKCEALDNLIPLLSMHPEPAVRRAVYAHCEADGIEIDRLAAQELMSWAEIREMIRNPLVSLGLLAADCHGAGDSPYDAVRDSFSGNRSRLADATGIETRHLAFSAGWHGFVETRDLDIAANLGFEAACLPAGGALFAEEPAPLLALPRVGLSNDVQVLMDAQAMCGAALIEMRTLQRRASAA